MSSAHAREASVILGSRMRSGCARMRLLLWKRSGKHGMFGKPEVEGDSKQRIKQTRNVFIKVMG